MPRNNPHILIYGTFAEAHQGGIEYNIEVVTQGLKDQYDFSLLCRAHPDFLKRIPATYYPLEQIHSAFSPHGIQKTAQQFTTINPDLILIYDPRGSTLGAPAAHKLGIPVINYRHTAARDRKKNIKSLLYTLGERWVAQRYLDASIFVSHRDYQECLQQHITPKSKSHFIPNRIDGIIPHSQSKRLEIRQHLHLAPSTFLWIHIGRMTEQKAHDVILDALHKLPKTPKWHLIMIGDGVNRPIIENTIKTYNLEQYITLTGATPRHQTLDILGAGDAFLLPSRWEKHPYSLLEALMFELPAIVTNVGDMWHILGEGTHPPAGVCVPTNNPEALQDAMTTFMTQNTLYHDYKNNCNVRSLTYKNTSLMLKELDQIFQQVLRQND